MTENHARNRTGHLFHLCLAVCGKEKPRQILGWCGLDGKENPRRPEIFVLLHETVRGRGYGMQCARALLEYAFHTAGLKSVHGGCDRQNIASAWMMRKGGMCHYGDAPNGTPLFLAE